LAKGRRQKVVWPIRAGLDTAIILKCGQDDLWLRGGDLHGRDLGQGEELDGRDKACCWALPRTMSSSEDRRKEFRARLRVPMFRANALYEGQYLLGTSIARR